MPLRKTSGLYRPRRALDRNFSADADPGHSVSGKWAFWDAQQSILSPCALLGVRAHHPLGNGTTWIRDCAEISA